MKATPRRLYRDSAIIYGVSAAIVLVFGLAVGRGVLWSIGVALGAFVLATSYSWWRIKRRAEAEKTSP